MSTLYSQLIGRTSPGLIIILIDQSSSMNDMFGGSGGEKKSVFAAQAVNDLIFTLLAKCQVGSEIYDRFYLGIIGYGDTVGAIVGGKISAFEKNNIGKETKRETNPDGTEVDISFPIWLVPKANNGTPMASGFDEAYKLAHIWVEKNKDSFPPVVINITDGVPNDLQQAGGDGKVTYAAAQRLMELYTNDGNLLLLNAHIGDSSKGTVLLPNDINLLTDQYAKYLFSISSVMPDQLIENANKFHFNPSSNARGLVFNAGAEKLIDLLNFGSLRFT